VIDMSGLRLPPRYRLVLLGAYGLLALAAACNHDQSIGYGPPRRPLDFIYFLHPGAVDSGTPSQLRAGVVAGSNLCWSVAYAAIQRQGDHLWIFGTAQYRSLGACPEAIAYDTLTLTIPPLEPGDYILTTGGLADTLAVRSPAPRPSAKRFAAFGDICETDRGCVLFGCDHPSAEEFEGMVTRGLPAGPSPGPTCRIVAAGTVAGRDTCSGRERNAIELRGYEWSRP
jgi:hypothetical protein